MGSEFNLPSRNGEINIGFWKKEAYIPMANDFARNPLEQETITVCGQKYNIISGSFEVPREQRPFGLMTPDDIFISPERVLTLHLMPAVAMHDPESKKRWLGAKPSFSGSGSLDMATIVGWVPPPAPPAPTVTATPAADEPAPRYFDLRLHEHKHWKDKLKVTYEGADVSNMVVAAHAGECWVTLFVKDTKDVATDPLVVRRGKVTIGKKG